MSMFLLPASLRSFPNPRTSWEQVSDPWLHLGFRKSGSAASGLNCPAPVKLSPHSLLPGCCCGPGCSSLGHFLPHLHLFHLHHAGHWKAGMKEKGQGLYLTFKRPQLCSVGNCNSKRMVGRVHLL